MAHANGATSPTIDYHEERIQRLEEASKDVSIKLEKSVLQTEHLSEQVEEMSQVITSKLDETLAALGKNLEETTKAVEAVSSRVRDIEKDHTADRVKWGKLKRIIFAAMAGGVGIAATKLVDVWVK